MRRIAPVSGHGKCQGVRKKTIWRHKSVLLLPQSHQELTKHRRKVATQLPIETLVLSSQPLRNNSRDAARKACSRSRQKSAKRNYNDELLRPPRREAPGWGGYRSESPGERGAAMQYWVCPGLRGGDSYRLHGGPLSRMAVRDRNPTSPSRPAIYGPKFGG